MYIYILIYIYIYIYIYIQRTKDRNISRYQTTSLLKTRFLFLVCKKGEKEDKRKFVIKFVGIIVTIIFM